MEPEPLEYRSPGTTTQKDPWGVLAQVVKWTMIVIALTFTGVFIAIILLLHHIDAIGGLGDH